VSSDHYSGISLLVAAQFILGRALENREDHLISAIHSHFTCEHYHGISSHVAAHFILGRDWNWKKGEDHPFSAIRSHFICGVHLHLQSNVAPHDSAAWPLTDTGGCRISTYSLCPEM
jgi:hypothetical protein